MTFDAKYLKTVEKAMKLMTKYQMAEWILPDGTKLLKTLHLAPALAVKSPKTSPINAVNDPLAEIDVRFAAVPKLKQNEFAMFRAGNVLASRKLES
jgi:hypothetical protein